MTGATSQAATPAPATAAQRLVLVTGPSGAGRTTAIAALADLGWEPIDNLPLTFVPRLFEGQPPGRPVALGLDVRNRDFSVAGLVALCDRLRADPGLAVDLLYLDCRPEVLVNRYAETRRRHPLSPAEPAAAGVARELDLLRPLREAADVLVDTTELSPHDLRGALERLFGAAGAAAFAVSVHSFAFKRGVPPGIDLMFDCRFLRNPYWDAGLRPLDGRSPAVAAHVAADPLYAEFFDRMAGLVELVLPAQRAAGRPHLAIGLGCTGGQHRSVTVAENLARRLADGGWPVSIRHRELERRAESPAPPSRGEGS